MPLGLCYRWKSGARGGGETRAADMTNIHADMGTRVQLGLPVIIVTAPEGPPLQGVDPRFPNSGV